MAKHRFNSGFTITGERVSGRIQEPQFSASARQQEQRTYLEWEEMTPTLSWDRLPRRSWCESLDPESKKVLQTCKHRWRSCGSGQDAEPTVTARPVLGVVLNHEKQTTVVPVCVSSKALGASGDRYFRRPEQTVESAPRLTKPSNHCG